ncbi:hypothetical protein PY093_21140 [Cytobacillus sp. S13-E01]|nr:hypothetical protein [Cytobacillus sp. S13-E01]MDF0729113.1 hypothetical protein [Cytobacillus sp. S13-E01]
MIFRMFVFLFGFGLAIIGGISAIAYLNLLTTGHGITEYFLFISRRLECYMLPLGIFLLWTSIYYPSKK